MLLSRGPSILRNICKLNGRKQTGVNLKQIRNCWGYRSVPEPKIQVIMLAEFAGGMAWWWIFWNAWHDYEHIIGHFPEIRPIDWSDEELGIPSD